MRPIKTNRGEIIAKWNGNAVRHSNRVHIRNQAHLCQLCQRTKLRLARGTVSNAGVFVNVFKRREKPELARLDRTTQSAHIVLARERLLGIRRGIFNRVTRVQRSGSFIECSVAVPHIRAALGADHDGARGRAAGVRVFLRRADGKLLNRIRRNILQESANVIVGVIAAIHGEFDVEPRAAAERNRRNARFRGIRRLNRFSPRRQIGDIRKAAMRERNGFEILRGDNALQSGAGRVDRLCGDRRNLPIHGHGLTNGGRQ